MKYLALLSLCIFCFLACNKEDDAVLADDNTVPFLHDFGKGITKNLMAMRHTYDSLHNPVQDTSTVLYFSDDSITPGEFSPLRKELKIVKAIAARHLQSGDGMSHYYDYYNTESKNRSSKLLKLVTSVQDTDTTFNAHHYNFSGNQVAADTTITWYSYEASVDTSITHYYL